MQSKRLSFSWPFLAQLVIFLPNTMFAVPGAASGAVPGNVSEPCQNKRATVEVFHVNSMAGIDQSAGKQEGPACVDVFFNPLRYNLALSGVASFTPGPDLGTVISTGAVKAIAGVTDADIQQLQSTVKDIKSFISYVDNLILTGNSSDYLQTLIIARYMDKGGAQQSLHEELSRALTLANDIMKLDLSANTPNNTQAKALIPIIRYWTNRFTSVGLMIGDDSASNPPVPSQLKLALHQRQENACGNLFNNTGSTAYSLSIVDVTPTLDDAASTGKSSQIQNFMTITCTTPFAASAGVELVTVIRNQEFGIIKAPGGPNNTSINKYGYVTDEPVHAIPIVVASMRAIEFHNKVYALHYSLGVAGNIQSQGSGGSSVEFLPGGSISFFRTMFLTFGPHIGYKPVLAGGVKVGDTVATDVATPQVTKTTAVGFGIAITFTKP